MEKPELVIGQFWNNVIYDNYGFSTYITFGKMTHTSLLNEKSGKSFTITIAEQSKLYTSEHKRQLFLFFHEVGHLSLNSFKMDKIFLDKFNPADSLARDDILLGVNAIDDIIINFAIPRTFIGLEQEVRAFIEDNAKILKIDEEEILKAAKGKILDPKSLAVLVVFSTLDRLLGLGLIRGELDKYVGEFFTAFNKLRSVAGFDFTALYEKGHKFNTTIYMEAYENVLNTFIKIAVELRKNIPVIKVQTEGVGESGEEDDESGGQGSSPKGGKKESKPQKQGSSSSEAEESKEEKEEQKAKKGKSGKSKKEGEEGEEPITGSSDSVITQEVEITLTDEEIKEMASEIEKQKKQHSSTVAKPRKLTMTALVNNADKIFENKSYLPFFKKALEEAMRGLSKKFNDEKGNLVVSKYVQALKGGTPNIFKRATEQSVENSKWMFVIDVSGSTLSRTIPNYPDITVRAEIEIAKTFINLLPTSSKFYMARFAEQYQILSEGFVNRNTAKMFLAQCLEYDRSIDGTDTIWGEDMVKEMYDKAKEKVQVVVFTDGLVEFENEKAKNLAIRLFSEINYKPILFFFGKDFMEYASGISEKAHLRTDIDFNAIVDGQKANKNLLKYLTSIFRRY